MKHLKLMLALLLMLSLLAGCGGEEKTSLKVCLGGVEDRLDPAMTQSDGNGSILLHLYENLLRLESDGNGGVKPVNAVASDYTETDNYDGTVSYCFSISPSAVWSDGEAVTAADFVYAWQRIMDPELDSPNRALLSMISGYDEAVEKGDPTLLAVSETKSGELKVTTSYHCPFFLQTVCAGAATMPVRRDIVEKYGESWSSLTQELVTNGAYTLTEWDVQDHITLTRNGENDDSAADELTFVFASDAETAENLFSSGSVSFAAPVSEAGVAHLKAVNPDWAPSPYPEIEMVRFGGVCAENTELRRAFFLSADMAAVHALLSATDLPLTGFIPRGILNSEGAEFRAVSSGMDISPDTYEKRCEDAAAALAASEVQDTTFTLVCLNDEQHQSVAAALADAWQEKLGVSVHIEALAADELAARLTGGDYDLAIAAKRGAWADATAYLGEFSQSSEEEPEGAGRASRILSILSGALDPLARDSYLLAAEDALLSDCAAIPLLQRGIAAEKAEGMQNIVFDGVGHYLFHTVTLNG